MNELESKLAEMMKEKSGNLHKFSVEIDMPWSTLDSILRRGIKNANIQNVFKITKALHIDAESLVYGEIVDLDDVERPQEDWSADELAEIEKFKEFIKSQRIA